MILQKLLMKDKGARKMFYTCIDWYWVSGGIWTYLYSECTASTNGSGTGSSGGDGITPAAVVGRLCGNYTFTRTGNGRTAEILALGAQAYNSSNENIVTALWGSMCITFGSTIQTSNNASIAFNSAWNTSLTMTDAWLTGHQNATSLEFSQQILENLRVRLNVESRGSYSLSTGPCENVPSSVPQYCN